jgi:hypothetical protein
MAATPITRKQFEDWLYERCPVFEPQDRRGWYLCPITNLVAIQVNMRGVMKLVVRKSGRRLSLGTTPRTHYVHRRTVNWRKNWAKSFDALLDVYKENRAELIKKARRVGNLPKMQKKRSVPMLSSRNQQALVTALDRLEVEAFNALAPMDVQTATGPIRVRVKEGRVLTKRQAAELRKKLAKYKIYVPSVIAA